MKFSLIAAASAIAFAATANADSYSFVNLYSGDSLRGTCQSIAFKGVYGECYDVSGVRNPVRSAAFGNGEHIKNRFTVTFYDTANCGGRWTRASFKKSFGLWASWDYLDNVSGNVKSVKVTNDLAPSGSGQNNDYALSKKLTFRNCFPTSEHNLPETLPDLDG
ncbi:MAG: hypothetical protein J3Q66DRAFT_399449 [Benniella sp.]|nr:MAG: hypothetical protein J3Q66DRAFT_399449 [Benniella sp.]